MVSYEERKEKVQTVPYEQAMKLIYEWVKKDVIGLKEFRKLIQDNRDSIW